MAGESKEPEQPNTATAVTTQDGGTVHDLVVLQLSDETRAETTKTLEAWKCSARRTYATLTLVITPEVGSLLADILDPHTMWKKLKELYAPKG